MEKIIEREATVRVVSEYYKRLFLGDFLQIRLSVLQYTYLSVYIYMQFIRKKNMNNQNPIEIYQAQDGTTQVEVRFENDTVWLSLQQIADLFGRDKSVISRHLRNIYTDGELNREATVAKNATVQIEGKRQINRTIEYYNLDVIISVGYRV